MMPIGPNDATHVVTQVVTDTQTAQTAYRWIAAWTVVLVMLALLTRTTIGYKVVYYLVVLCILIITVTQYHAIASILSPIANMPDTQVSNASPDARTATGAVGQPPTSNVTHVVKK